MSKKNRNNDTSNDRPNEPIETNDPIETKEAAMSNDTTTTPANPSTDLATAPASEVVQDDTSLAYMIPALPHLKDSLLKTHRVAPEEFEKAITVLKPDQKSAFFELSERLNPSQEFMDSDSQGLKLSMLKMDQGAGDDPAKPQNSVKGAIYSKPAGDLLTVTPNFSKTMGLPDKLMVYVLGMYNGRAFFAPRGADGKPQPPPGIELRGNAPICLSFDRKKGSRFSDCASCAYRPFANGTVDRSACKDNVDLFICLGDLSNLYQISVQATSFKTCTQFISQKLNGKKNPWDMPFYLTTKKVQRPGQEFYVWEAQVVTSAEAPNGVQTDESLKGLLGLFARQIRTEKHLPRLASIYAAAANQGGPHDVVDVASADAIAAAAGGMDYSQAGSGNV